MARLRKPTGSEKVAFIQRERDETYEQVTLYTYGGRAWLHVGQYHADGCYLGGFQFRGIKSIRKFAFAILDATGGRGES